ncbi:hypothetical protein KC19_2G060300 [Ceratodon purpureus]|uniref:Uncharacterized protein n=1 Tax=Ceratodon purpureus TaxID=3225 RepID=A0A8T0IQM9_CERPU|nr:hypothetical protein KC19_2G060300 [Ceratodon purpureus]
MPIPNNLLNSFRSCVLGVSSTTCSIVKPALLLSPVRDIRGYSSVVRGILRMTISYGQGRDLSSCLLMVHSLWSEKYNPGSAVIKIQDNARRIQLMRTECFILCVR